MKVDGFTYYWIVFGGMNLPLMLVYPLGKYETQIEANHWLIAGVLLISLINAICYLVVVIEMWQRFRFKVVAIAAAFYASAFLIHPYFILLVVLAPPVYWISRIRGLPSQA